MIQATTPMAYFKFPIDPTVCQRILITYSQGNEIILTKDETELTMDSATGLVSFQFTQEETNLFDPQQMAMVQVRARLDNDEVVSSPIYRIRVYPTLNDEVI